MKRQRSERVTLAKEQTVFEDDYDNYEINSLSDLFRLIELRLKEGRRFLSLFEEAERTGYPIAAQSLSPEKYLQNAYNEVRGHANSLWKANPSLIEPPPPTPNNEKNLENLRDWCTDPRRHRQQEDNIQDVIQIDSKHFSKTVTWQLLKEILEDERREGVKCPKRRLKRLKERLKKAGSDYGKEDYITLAQSLKYTNGLARTTIPFGKIHIIPRK